MSASGYALDLMSAVRHVATELDRAPSGALSIDDMAATYHHPVPSDLSRIRQHENAANEHEAVRVLIAKAIMALKTQVEENGNGTYHLTRPFDELRYNRKKLHRSLPSIFNSPFDPMKGNGTDERPAFAENIRHNQRPNKTLDDELRESMRMFGWLPYHPAVKDERGVVLVGHRRLRVAEELGIEPQIVTHSYGSGDAADIERFKIAVGSNMGAKGLTDTDWKAIARSMRAEGWTQQAIADALERSQSAVQREVHDLPTVGNSEKPKRGRPRVKTTPEEEAQVIALMDAGVRNRAQVAEQTGLGEHQVQRVMRDENVRRAALETSPPEPEPTPEDRLDHARKLIEIAESDDPKAAALEAASECMHRFVCECCGERLS